MGKTYAAMAFVAGLILAFFKIFSMGANSKANEIKAESEEAARTYQEAGSEAGRVGHENEEKVKNEDSNADINRYR